MAFLVYILFAYLFGAIPWGVIVAKFKGVDIQRRGSGNTGATNIYRTMGLSYGLLVGLLDVSKGAIVMTAAKFSLNSHYQIALIALAVILGHVFSIFLGGKGGKGVGTTFGVALVLVGWQFSLIVLGAWIVLILLTRFMSLTNLILIWVLPSYFVFINPDFAYFILSALVTLLIYWAHRENIDRLKEGRELRLNVKIAMKTDRPKYTAAPAPVKAARRVSKAKKALPSKTPRKKSKK
jgi:glycerol-3-phosphate acyltransferase PlsY